MILNFTNINKFVIISFSFLFFFLGCSCNVCNDYTINIKNENYELFFFSTKGEVLLNRTYPKKPHVSKVNENLFKVVYSTGLDCNYTFFVDTKSKKVSEDYFNLLFHNDSEIVFLEDGTIYVADLFVENIRTSIKLDFSVTLSASTPRFSTTIFFTFSRTFCSAIFSPFC